MPLAEQFHLWDTPDLVTTEPCPACGIGLRVIRPSPTPGIREWKCRECHMTGAIDDRAQAPQESSHA